MDEFTRLLRNEHGVKVRRREEILEQQKALEGELKSLDKELSAMETLLQVRNGQPLDDSASSALDVLESGEPPNVTQSDNTDTSQITTTSVVVAFVLSAGRQGVLLEEIWSHLLKVIPNAKRKDLHQVLYRQVKDTHKFVMSGTRYVHVDSLKT